MERLVRLLSLCNVNHDACHAEGRPVSRPNHLPTILDPADGSIGPDNPMFDLILIRCSLESRLDALLDVIAILGMHEVQKSLVGASERAIGESENGFDVPRPRHLIRIQVPSPRTHLRRFERQLEPFTRWIVRRLVFLWGLGGLLQFGICRSDAVPHGVGAPSNEQQKDGVDERCRWRRGTDGERREQQVGGNDRAQRG